jgi:ketosteroid isomerase-like protein
MRRLSIFSFFIFFIHCAYGQLTEEVQKITGEILAVTEKYNHTWETLNMSDVAKFHSDSTFKYYRNMKSSVSNNDEFKKKLPVYMKDIKKWTIKVSNSLVQVLTKDVAVISFTGVAELVTIDNKTSDTGTGAYTYIWKKENDQWKLVHIHESTK